jgi:hypothetical protein
VYHKEKADSRWSSGPLTISNAIAMMNVSSAALSFGARTIAFLRDG